MRQRPVLVRDSSRSSQFFANFQSLITVSGEIFNTSAVSSTLNPPKNRSSTTWLFRSYCAASARSASSMAIRSSGVSLATARFSIERHATERTTALLVLSGPGEIHEHAPHEASGHREKVRAILPLHPTNIHQPEVDLVDERGGLENVVRTLARHVPLRKAPQLAVHEREQPLHGSGVAAPPFDQKGCHVVGSDIGHGPAHSTCHAHDSCSRRFAPLFPTGGFGLREGRREVPGMKGFYRASSSVRVEDTLISE